MAFSEQIEKVVSSLTDLTGQGKVSWQEGPVSGSFLAPVADSVVTISRGGSELYGAYSFQILDQKGRAIDGAVAFFVGPEKDPVGNKNWRRLGELHDMARRNALNSDQAVSSLLSSLEQMRR